VYESYAAGRDGLSLPQMLHFVRDTHVLVTNAVTLSAVSAVFGTLAQKRGGM
jgi:hypothetical protein